MFRTTTVRLAAAAAALVVGLALGGTPASPAQAGPVTSAVGTCCR